jgi:hypothetical protein
MRFIQFLAISAAIFSAVVCADHPTYKQGRSRKKKKSYKSATVTKGKPPSKLPFELDAEGRPIKPDTITDGSHQRADVAWYEEDVSLTQPYFENLQQKNDTANLRLLIQVFINLCAASFCMFVIFLPSFCFKAPKKNKKYKETIDKDF